MGATARSSLLITASIALRLDDADNNENHTRPICEERENAETNWIWIRIAREAKVRCKNDDEERSRSNAKEQQSDPEETRHTPTGGGLCDVTHKKKYLSPELTGLFGLVSSNW